VEEKALGEALALAEEQEKRPGGLKSQLVADDELLWRVVLLGGQGLRGHYLDVVVDIDLLRLDPGHGLNLRLDLSIEQIDEALGAWVARAEEQAVVRDLRLSWAQETVDKSLMQVNHGLNLEVAVLEDSRMALVRAARLAERSYDANWSAEGV
jgi:hypothetical protein